MDAFDQIAEEFASTINRMSSTDAMSERERPDTRRVKSAPRLPAAQKNAASSTGSMEPLPGVKKRRRQAHPPKLSKDASPAGNKDQQSESLQDTVTHSVQALGSDERALGIHASQVDVSPLVAQVSDDRAVYVVRSTTVVGGDEGTRFSTATQCGASPLVSEITQLWRMRQRWHRAEKSLVLQGKALCRGWAGGDKDAANALYAKAEAALLDDLTLSMALAPFLDAVERFEGERSAIEKRLRKLAQSSPLWPWVSQVKGFGPLNLAALIGETGEIAAYRNPSCLWKRMGMAVIDGGRQRRVADAEKALIHGYAPARRCVAYLLGDTLIKSGDACRYRPVYTARRERTAETHPDWTKAHSHNDGARIMVKRVLRDLWCEARRLQREELA